MPALHLAPVYRLLGGMTKAGLAAVVTEYGVGLWAQFGERFYASLLKADMLAHARRVVRHHACLDAAQRLDEAEVETLYDWMRARLAAGTGGNGDAAKTERDPDVRIAARLYRDFLAGAALSASGRASRRTRGIGTARPSCGASARSATTPSTRTRAPRDRLPAGASGRRRAEKARGQRLAPLPVSPPAPIRSGRPDEAGGRVGGVGSGLDSLGDARTASRSFGPVLALRRRNRPPAAADGRSADGRSARRRSTLTQPAGRPLGAQEGSGRRRPGAPVR